MKWYEEMAVKLPVSVSDSANVYSPIDLLKHNQQQHTN